MDKDSNKVDQDNERLALKSIYGEEMLELLPESHSEGEWFPFECIITLRGPQPNSEQPGPPVISLHVKCTSDYPNQIPIIKLEDWKRISNQSIKHLQNELEELALKHMGEVMIFQLSQHVENFLHTYNEQGSESFYDEMMKRQKKERENEQQLKEAENEKKKKEIQVKEQAVRKALRRRQNSTKSVEEELEVPGQNTSKQERPKHTKAQTEEVTQTSKSIKRSDDNPWILCDKSQSRFNNEFEHLSSLGQGAFGHVIKVRNKLDDGLYAIKQIVLDPSEKQLNKKITREVKLLSRLNHENVVRYYNSWLEFTDKIIPNESLSEYSEIEDYGGKQTLGDDIVDMLPQTEIIDWSNEIPIGSDKESEDIVIFRSASDEESDEMSHISDCTTVPWVPSPHSDEGTPPTRALVMYIQMELCDKSTLRLAIDNGLYSDVQRVWRLFREIVEGLCHIHQQGIIHRDLKPVNIFLGNDDHVKIGDFGLATTIVLQKQTRDVTHTSSISDTSTPQASSQTDTSQTGQIGTTLYVAPELNGYPLRSSYNQKVDIYSLGIIFFEMCTPPMETTMERIQTLNSLRQEIPKFPEPYHLEENSPQRSLMRAMLQYDVDKRPSAQELLQNSAIPPPLREESEVSLMIKRTLSNPQSRNYKFLISSCFEQKLQPSLDATYNVSSWRPPIYSFSFEIVTKKLRKVFQTHGASSFSPPLLTPADQVLDSAVCLMTRFGSIVHATHDLQAPFARFIAQNPSVCQLKRYAIDKVYRERPAGVHPREIYECAFDIITPSSGDLLPEYEIMCVIWEILREFPSILSKNCVIYLNHSLIISVMLKVAGLDHFKFYSQRISIFQKNGLFNSKKNFAIFLKSLGLPEKTITYLTQWMEIEGTINKVTQHVLSLLKDTQYVAEIKIAFLQLEAICNFVKIIGIDCPVLISLGHIRNAHYYSGAMVQVVYTEKSKPRQNEHTVLLSGGRYDHLVQIFKESLSRDDVKVNQYVIGFTLSVDKLIYSIVDDEKTSMIDVMVCAIGKISISHDKLCLLHDLWKSGLKSSFNITVENLEEIQNRCKDLKVPVIVLLKETDSGFARVRTLAKERYFEKKVNYSELLDFIWKFKTTLMEAENGSLKQETKTHSSEGPVIYFITQDKLTPLLKRRYESQIMNNVQALLPKFSIKIKIEIIAFSLDSEVLKALSDNFDPNCNEYDISPLLKKYPKHKKIIQKFQDHIDDAKSTVQEFVFILYSLVDNTYNVLL